MEVLDENSQRLSGIIASAMELDGLSGISTPKMAVRRIGRPASPSGTG